MKVAKGQGEKAEKKKNGVGKSPHQNRIPTLPESIPF